MTLKSKITAALKTKYSNLGFSQKTVDTVADYLISAGATEESDIETLVGGVEGLLRAFQGDTDSRVTAAVAKAKKDAQGGGADPAEPREPDANPPTNTSNPEIAKLTQLVTGLAQAVTGLVEKDKTTSLQQRFKSAANEKGIKNDTLISKWMPKTDEEFDTALSELETFNKDFVIQQANQQSTGTPAAGGGDSSFQNVDTKKGESVLDNWVKQSPVGAQTSTEKK